VPRSSYGSLRPLSGRGLLLFSPRCRLYSGPAWRGRARRESFMQWTGLNELREKYLSFFEGKGHLRLGSFPLVPKDDPSLLLINSGMAPMKKWFLGQEEPPRHRVTTCQKC